MSNDTVFQVVIFKDEHGFYNAISLQTDVVACSRDLEEVKHDIAELIEVHVADCVEEGEDHDIFRPAPQEYWQMFRDAEAGQITSMELGFLEMRDGIQ